MTTITEIEIVPVKPRDGLVAFASCVIDHKWYVGNIAIHSRLSGGYRLVYPTKKVGEHNVPIFHPIDKNVGDDVEQAIVSKLEELWKTHPTSRLNAL